MSIINHIVLGTNDLQKGTQFYDAVLGALGIRNLGPMGEVGTFYGDDHPEFIIMQPANGEAACYANGGTIGFKAASRDAVNKFHELGMANGGTDEGAPGPRDILPNAYAAYVRDPDGNKICTYCFAPE